MKQRYIWTILIFCLVVFAVQAQPPTPERRIKAVAFDAFPVFDPRPLAVAIDNIFPGHGKVLMQNWFSKIFEYQWLRLLGGQYEDFMSTAEAALVFTVKKSGFDLIDSNKTEILSMLLKLKMWPDAALAIQKLSDMGVTLVFLSNMTETMLVNGLNEAGLRDCFEYVLSTDSIQSYKPHPDAYQLAIEALNLKKEEILFVAFASWDVTGSKWFGYETYWVNRLGMPSEELGELPDDMGHDLSELVTYVANRIQLTS